jgi:L-threonylcarbamoyladenylate synthase
MQPAHPGILTIEEAVVRLGEGGVVVFPTETFYAIGCLPTCTEALARVFRIKGRPHDRPLPLLAASLATVRESFAMSQDELHLCQRFWPGPLTVLLTSAMPLPQQVRNARGRTAVRISPHPAAAAIAERCGLVTATSANPTGQAPACRPEDLDAGILSQVDGLVAHPTLPAGGSPSTIVEIGTGDRRLRVLRPGAIPPSALAAVKPDVN